MQVTLRQFVRDLKHIIAQNGGQLSLKLGKGQCPDFPEYKRQVGFISGLEAAGELAEKMLTQIEEADVQGDLPEMEGLTSE